ncbi:MAG: DUF4388 domain-containing protein [Deltaproteobacteria bacterium]|nr:DUF4388 domain-containing protein [Deltaproteobacteria bacterium]MBN2672748.1 DUF4388 domain-containing protein [Deltaproteobacteria bacterium]
MAKLALRFISGKYKGKEHILEDGKETVIGRSSDADVVLMEDMVSRRHTLMMVNGDEIRVTDNGSTNGTFVNGEKITSTTAVKGDRILIGTSIMKLVDASDQTQAVSAVHPTINSAISPRIAQQQAAVPRPGGSSMNRTTMHSGARSMSGTIAEVPLPDLIQLFSTSKKTGTLVLNHNFTIAKIHLDKGSIIFASISDMPSLDPLKAMFRILSWDDGDFDLMGPEPHNFPSRIEMPTEHILMEGLRQLDELRRQKSQLPNEDTKVTIPRPLNAKLSLLAQAELDIFQIVFNHREISIRDLINATELSDKEAADVLQKLLTTEYLEAELI